MQRVVALGDVNVDIIAHFPSFPGKGEDALALTTEIHCGGSAANTAMALARMGIGTSLIARVGPDSWALKVYGCLSEAGVSPSALQRDPAHMTGLMYVVVTPDGERTILGNRGANVHTDPDQIDENEFRDATFFHLSGYALLEDPQRRAALRALQIASRHDLTVSLDPGMTVPHKALQDMHALLPAVNILIPSLAEAQQLTGKSEPDACAGALRRMGVEVVALKLGHRGSLVASEEGTFRVPGFAIQVRDSTGAGDNFAAGLIAGFLGGLEWRGAAVLGNALGAISAARVGAGTTDTQAHDVLDMLRERWDGSSHPELLRAVAQAIDYVTTLSTQPKEEGEPWWR
ncbi:MAG: carbohydrate kinase family protein [Anaerolineae bacterium]|jgi:ribokinase